MEGLGQPGRLHVGQEGPGRAQRRPTPSAYQRGRGDDRPGHHVEAGSPQLGRQQLRPGKRPDHGSVGVAELGRNDQLSGHEVRVEAASHPDDRHRRIVGQGRRQRDPLGPGLGPPSPAHLDSATDRQRLDPQGGHHHELSHGHSPGGSGPAP